jgi:hypothetical protein
MVAAYQTLKGAVFVLGMHRSGTSAIARGLEVLGVSLGGNLKPPVVGDNDKGFFEDWALSTINDELLALQGGQWGSLLARSPGNDGSDAANALKLRAIAAIQAEFGTVRYFGFKDPRSCRTAPFWKDVLAKQGLKAFYVIAFRNPMSVARSLERRDSFTRHRSYYLWLLHMLSAVRDTRGESRLFVEYDDLVANPGETLARIARLIDDPQIEVSANALRDYARNFLDADLRHHVDMPAHLDLDNACPDDVRAVYDLLRAEQEESKPRAELDSAWDQCFDTFAKVAPYSELMDSLDREIHDTRSALQRRLDEVDRLNVQLSAQAQRLAQELSVLAEHAAREFSTKDETIARLHGEIALAQAQLEQSRDEIKALTERVVAESLALAERDAALKCSDDARARERTETADRIERMRAEGARRAGELERAFAAAREESERRIGQLETQFVEKFRRQESALQTQAERNTELARAYDELAQRLLRRCARSRPPSPAAA